MATENEKPAEKKIAAGAVAAKPVLKAEPVETVDDKQVVLEHADGHKTTLALEPPRPFRVTVGDKTFERSRVEDGSEVYAESV
jgi:hypothetical protein